MAGYNNFSYVIDSSFRPFSMQEMLTPLTLYKDAYEKTEEAYAELADKVDIFKDLAKQTEDNPKAKAIYEGYAKELDKQAKDLAQHGLSMGNRAALTNLRRRYQGEIGQLATANERLQELLKQRNALAAAGKPMLYANENPTLDDFLGQGNTFNRYSIDSTDLHTAGQNLGKAISSRIYKEGEEGSVLQDYYRDWVTRYGVSPESMDAFMNSNVVQNAINNTLVEKGVVGNLTGANYNKALQTIKNGIYEGVIYQEKHNPVRDPGVLSEAERRSDARANRSQIVTEAMNGITWENGKPVYNPEGDLSMQRSLAAIRERAAARAAAGTSSGGSSSEYGAINQQGVRVSWKGNNENDTNGEADEDVETAPLDKDEAYSGTAYEYDDLPQYAKNMVDKIIGKKGDYDNYIYYFRPYSGGLFNDQEAALDIVPRRVIKDNASAEAEDIDGMSFDVH